MGVPVPELPSESSGSEDDDDEPWTHLPVSEMDLTLYDQCTPSYRAFPSERPKDRCTVRVPVEAAMLNDNWVSVPTGSEEDFFFKTTRKNQYEEALFRCEDEQVRPPSPSRAEVASSAGSRGTDPLDAAAIRSRCRARAVHGEWVGLGGVIFRGPRLRQVALSPDSGPRQ